MAQSRADWTAFWRVLSEIHGLGQPATGHSDTAGGSEDPANAPVRWGGGTVPLLLVASVSVPIAQVQVRGPTTACQHDCVGHTSGD